MSNHIMREQDYDNPETYKRGRRAGFAAGMKAGHKEGLAGRVINEDVFKVTTAADEDEYAIGYSAGFAQGFRWGHTMGAHHR